MKLVLSTLTALAFAMSAAPAAAQNAAASQPRAVAPSALVISVNNITANADAAKGAARKDSTVHAGDVLRYTLTFTNVVARAVRGVELKNPLPAGLRLVDGSAKASRTDARAEFSADGGKSFSAMPNESMTIDGRDVKRPIASERFTHVRWVIDGSVQPRATVVAQYEVTVAGSATSK